MAYYLFFSCAYEIENSAASGENVTGFLLLYVMVT